MVPSLLEEQSPKLACHPYRPDMRAMSLAHKASAAQVNGVSVSIKSSQFDASQGRVYLRCLVLEQHPSKATLMYAKRYVMRHVWSMLLQCGTAKTSAL